MATTTAHKLQGKAVQLGNSSETEYLFNHKFNSWVQVGQVASAADGKVCAIGEVLSGYTATLVALKIVDANTFEALFDEAPGSLTFVLTVIGGIGDEVDD